MGKMAWDGPKWGQRDFFHTNPDLADILGGTDLDFENFHFLWNPKSGKSDRAWARPGAGPQVGLL